MIAKVLLVDDESPFVEALAKRLTLREIQVSIALSGPEALEKLGKEPSIDVVVLDVKMPGMDGIETLKAIKNRYPLIEIIMLTGHATVESAIDGMKVGALDYLMKPCDMDVLMAKVREAKNKKAAQEAKIAEARAMQIVLRRGD
ncbi:MAG: response regulator [Deltaproteobacteria bacterium]|nr:response regulator [Deltaproteobacteria bacterium]